MTFDYSGKQSSQAKMSTKKNKGKFASKKSVHWTKRSKRVVLGAIQNVDHCGQENEEYPALVIKPELQPDEDELDVGRRLVDFNFFLKQMQAMNNHGPIGIV